MARKARYYRSGSSSRSLVTQRWPTIQCWPATWWPVPRVPCRTRERSRSTPAPPRPSGTGSGRSARPGPGSWATGAAGPTGNGYGDAAGHSCIAVSGPFEHAMTIETGEADRTANMFAFAAAALELLLKATET